MCILEGFFFFSWDELIKINWVALQIWSLLHENFKEFTDKLYCPEALSEGILEVFSISSTVHLSFLFVLNHFISQAKISNIVIYLETPSSVLLSLFQY